MEIQAGTPAKVPGITQRVFFNERGLRPGWRLGIFLPLAIALAVLLLGMLSFALRGSDRTQANSPAFLLSSEVASFLAVAIASWIMGRIERRDMGEYGLPLASGSLSRFATGYLLWGFLPLSLLLLALRGLGAFYFGAMRLHGMEIVSWAAMWGLVFLFVGLFEEYMFRGYMLRTLAEGIGFWPAAIVLAVAFALLHAGNPGESRLGVIMTAAYAIFASVTLRRTGNLWLAVGSHAGWDWGQSYFYGVADSGVQAKGHLLNPHTAGPEWLTGGTVGPEGSALVLPLMVIMSVLVVLFYPRKSLRVT